MRGPSDQASRKPGKFFIQMSGAPGSGKSTLASLLRQSLGGLVIDHDILRSTLLEDSSNGEFIQVAKCAYRLQWALARDVLKQGLNIIIDSPCNYQEGLDTGSALAEQYGFSYWYVECRVADINLLDERLRKRNPMKSQRTGIDRPPAGASGTPGSEDALALFKHKFENPCRPNRNVIVVDSSTGSPEMLRDRVLAEILGHSSSG